jgi:dihydrofolate synthase/folylpolyglutamate synthase
MSFITKHKRILQRRKLTFFEVVTALAFDYFARSRVDVAIIETGLGGRLDATNVLSPSLTITTDIDFDHTDVLGNTIGEISREKAGIIKSGKPHLMGLLPEPAVEIFANRCNEMKSPLFRLADENYQMHPQSMALDFKDEGLQLFGIAPALYGAHQLKNTALVLKAASLFRQNGLFVSKKAVIKGITKTNWPGRFQVLSRVGNPTVVLDVAHNPGGIRAVADAFKLRFPGKRARLVTGFVKKKNHQHMFDILSEISSEYALAPLKTGRSADLDELTQTIDFREIPARKFGSLAAAFNYLTKKQSSDDIICVVGSHYLVGEFLEKFGEKWPERPDKNQNRLKRQIRTKRPQKHRKFS